MQKQLWLLLLVMILVPAVFGAVSVEVTNIADAITAINDPVNSDLETVYFPGFTGSNAIACTATGITVPSYKTLKFTTKVGDAAPAKFSCANVVANKAINTQANSVVTVERIDFEKCKTCILAAGSLTVDSCSFKEATTDGYATYGGILHNESPTGYGTWLINNTVFENAVSTTPSRVIMTNRVAQFTMVNSVVTGFTYMQYLGSPYPMSQITVYAEGNITFDNVRITNAHRDMMTVYTKTETGHLSVSNCVFSNTAQFKFESLAPYTTTAILYNVTATITTSITGYGFLLTNVVKAMIGLNTLSSSACTGTTAYHYYCSGCTELVATDVTTTGCYGSMYWLGSNGNVMINRYTANTVSGTAFYIAGTVNTNLNMSSVLVTHAVPIANYIFNLQPWKGHVNMDNVFITGSGALSSYKHYMEGPQSVIVKNSGCRSSSGALSYVCFTIASVVGPVSFSNMSYEGTVGTGASCPGIASVSFATPSPFSFTDTYITGYLLGMVTVTGATTVTISNVQSISNFTGCTGTHFNLAGTQLTFYNVQTEYCSYGLLWDGGTVYANQHYITNYVSKGHNVHVMRLTGSQTQAIVNLTNIYVTHNTPVTSNYMFLMTAFDGHINIDGLYVTSTATDNYPIVYADGANSFFIKNVALINNDQILSSYFFQLTTTMGPVVISNVSYSGAAQLQAHYFYITFTAASPQDITVTDSVINGNYNGFIYVTYGNRVTMTNVTATSNYVSSGNWMTYFGTCNSLVYTDITTSSTGLGMYFTSTLAATATVSRWINSHTLAAMQVSASLAGAIMNFTNVTTTQTGAVASYHYFNADGWKGHMHIENFTYTSSNTLGATLNVFYMNYPASLIIRNVVITNSFGAISGNIFNAVNLGGPVTLEYIQYSGLATLEKYMFTFGFAQPFAVSVSNININADFAGFLQVTSADTVQVNNVRTASSCVTANCNGYKMYDILTSNQFLVDGVTTQGCGTGMSFTPSPSTGNIVIKNYNAVGHKTSSVILTGTSNYPIQVEYAAIECYSIVACRGFAISGAEITNINHVTYNGGGGFISYTARQAAGDSNDPRLNMRNITITNVLSQGNAVGTSTIGITGTIKFGLTLLDSRIDGGVTGANTHIFVSTHAWININNVVGSYAGVFLYTPTSAVGGSVSCSDMVMSNIANWFYDLTYSTSGGNLEVRRIMMVGKNTGNRGIRLYNIQKADMQDVMMNGTGSTTSTGGVLNVQSWISHAVILLDRFDVRGLVQSPYNDATHHNFVYITGAGGYNATVNITNSYFEHGATAPSQAAGYGHYILRVENVRNMDIRNVTMFRGVGAAYISTSAHNGVNGLVTITDTRVTMNMRNTNMHVWSLNGVSSTATYPGTSFIIQNTENSIVETGTYMSLATLVPHWYVNNYGSVVFNYNTVGNGSQVLYTRTASGVGNLTINTITMTNMRCSPQDASYNFPLYDVGAGPHGGVVRIFDVNTTCTYTTQTPNRPWRVWAGSDVEMYNLRNNGGEGFLHYNPTGLYSALAIPATVSVHDIVTTTMYGVPRASPTKVFTFYFAGDNIMTDFNIYNIEISSSPVSSRSTHFSFWRYNNISLFNITANAGDQFVEASNCNSTGSFYVRNIRYTGIPTDSVGPYITGYAGSTSGVMRISDMIMTSTNLNSRGILIYYGNDVVVENIQYNCSQNGLGVGLLHYVQSYAGATITLRNLQISGVGPVQGPTTSVDSSSLYFNIHSTTRVFIYDVVQTLATNSPGRHLTTVTGFGSFTMERCDFTYGSYIAVLNSGQPDANVTIRYVNGYQLWTQTSTSYETNAYWIQAGPNYGVVTMNSLLIDFKNLDAAARGIYLYSAGKLYVQNVTQNKGNSFVHWHNDQTSWFSTYGYGLVQNNVMNDFLTTNGVYGVYYSGCPSCQGVIEIFDNVFNAQTTAAGTTSGSFVYVRSYLRANVERMNTTNGNGIVWAYDPSQSYSNVTVRNIRFINNKDCSAIYVGAGLTSGFVRISDLYSTTIYSGLTNTYTRVIGIHNPPSDLLIEDVNVTGGAFFIWYNSHTKVDAKIVIRNVSFKDHYIPWVYNDGNNQWNWNFIGCTAADCLNRFEIYNIVDEAQSTSAGWMTRIQRAGDVVWYNANYRYSARCMYIDYGRSLTAFNIVHNEVTNPTTAYDNIYIYIPAVSTGTPQYNITDVSVRCIQNHVIRGFAATGANPGGAQYGYITRLNVTGCFGVSYHYSVYPGGRYIVKDVFSQNLYQANAYDVMIAQGAGGLVDQTFEFTNINLNSVNYAYGCGGLVYGFRIQYVKNVVMKDIFGYRLAAGMRYDVSNTDNAKITVNNYTMNAISYSCATTWGWSQGSTFASNVFWGKRADGRTEIKLYDITLDSVSTPAPLLHFHFEGVRDVSVDRLNINGGGSFGQLWYSANDLNFIMRNVTALNLKNHVYWSPLLYIFATDATTGATPRVTFENFYMTAPNALANTQSLCFQHVYQLTMTNVYFSSSAGRAIRYNSVDTSPYWYAGVIGATATFTNMTIEGTSMYEVFSMYANPANTTVVMRNVSMNVYTSSQTMLIYHINEIDFDGIKIQGGPANNANAKIRIEQGLQVPGTVSIKNVEMSYATQGAVELIRGVNGNTESVKYIIDGLYIHDCTNLLFGAKIYLSGTGSMHPDTGVYNMLAERNSLHVSAGQALVFFDRWVTYPGGVWAPSYNTSSSIPAWPLVMKNITLLHTTCAAGCTAQGIYTRFPTNITDLTIRNVVAQNTIVIHYCGPFQNTSVSRYTNWTIYNNTAYNNVLRISYGSPMPGSYVDHLPSTYPFPTSTGLKFWCNHVKNTLYAAGVVYADYPMTMNIAKWGGHTFDIDTTKNNTNRHMFADTVANGVMTDAYSTYWTRATIVIDDLYLMQIKTLDFGGYGSIPSYGGLTLKVVGDWLLSFENGRYGVITPENVTFRGIPLRDVRSVYDDEAYFVLGAYDAQKYSGNELQIRDSNGRQGLMCTNVEYESESTGLNIFPGNFSFTGVGVHHCHSGIRTQTSLYMTKFTGTPLVSVRCNLLRDGNTVYGDWYTPRSMLPTDMNCLIPCDKADVGLYSVTIDVLGNTQFNVHVEVGEPFSMDVHDRPVVQYVSSRFLLDGVATYIYGTGFPSVLTTAYCRYTKNIITSEAYDKYVEVQATVYNDTVMSCTASSLNGADNPTMGTPMDLKVTFWGVGSGWFETPRAIYKQPNFVYYNFDFSADSRPFIYMGKYNPLNLVAPNPTPKNIWTVGRPGLTYRQAPAPSGQQTTGMIYTSDANPMVCMFESDDGNITFVQPTSYTLYSYYYNYGSAVCDIPPSPGNINQTTRVWYGYWWNFAYQYQNGGYQVTYRYHPFLLKGLMFDRVTPNQYVIFDGYMSWPGYGGYGNAAVPTEGFHLANCTTALCVCKYTYTANGVSYTNTSFPLIYNGGLNSYKCLLPLMPNAEQQQITVSIMLNGWELGKDLTMKLRYVQNATNPKLNHFNGDLGTQIMVTGENFVDSTALVCGFARTTNGEYPGVFDGRVVYCYDNATIQAMVVSRAVYINSTNIMCVFDNFVMAKNASVANPADIKGPEWFIVDPADSYKYVCLGAYHHVYVGNTPDAMLDFRATNSSQQFQYMKIAQATFCEPQSANYLYQENVLVHGKYIAALGTPTCWWSQLLNNNTAMPPSPDQVPQGVWSTVVPGTFVILQEGNQVRCPLPKVDGIAFVGVVVSNNAKDLNTTTFGIFRYMSGMRITMLMKPSNITRNSVPLTIQPVMKVSDVEGNLVDKNRQVEVNVRTYPSALAMSGTSATADPDTGIAAFANLRIEGPQYESYNVCFQASTFDSQSPWECVCCTAVEACANMVNHSVEYKLGCVCDYGYQLTISRECDLCPLNRYRQDLGTDTCEMCPKHKVTHAPGAKNISECVCKDGFTTVGDDCQCPKGYGYNNLTESCWACTPGTFKDTVGNTGCIPCTADEFASGPVASNSSSQCTCLEGFQNSVPSDVRSPCVCTAGYYFNTATKMCWPCAIGQYKVNPGLESYCSSCPPGETTATAASTRATDCSCKTSFVRLNETDASSECVCKEGYEYDSQIYLICQACPPDSYKEARSRGRCSFCDPSMTTKESASTNKSSCTCREGFYVKPSDIGKAERICTSCPMGGYCKGGESKPTAKPGFYESNSVAEVFVKCQVPDACIGQDQCTEGYEGYKCGDCSLGFYRKGARCVECNNWARVVFYMAALGLFVFLALTFWTSFKPPIVLRLASLRIGWSFIQITALYAQFDLNWPPEVKEVYRALSFVILDIQITSPECSLNTKIDFYSLLIVKMVLPLIFAVMMGIIFGLSVAGVYGYGIWRKRQGMKEMNFVYKGPSVYKFMVFALIRSIMVLLVMFYVPLVQFVLQYFDCTWQDDGSWSLDAQPSIHCYEGKHMNYFPLVLYGAIVYVIGIPLYCARVLYKFKDKLLEPFVFARFGFLYARFKPKYFWWEIVIMVRLAVLVMCLMLVNTHVPVQTMAGITVLFMAALQHKDHKPFITDYLNKLETMSLVASVLTLLAGQVFYSGVDSPFIVTVLTALVLLLLLANVLVVVVILYLEWKPPEDPYKDFSEAVGDAPLEVFESNAGGLVVTMEMGMDSVGAGGEDFTGGYQQQDVGSGQAVPDNSAMLFDTNAAAGYEQQKLMDDGSNTYSSGTGQSTFNYSSQQQMNQMPMQQMGMQPMNQMTYQSGQFNNQQFIQQPQYQNNNYQGGYQQTMSYNQSPSFGTQGSFDQTQSGQFTQSNQDTFNMY